MPDNRTSLLVALLALCGLLTVAFVGASPGKENINPPSNSYPDVDQKRVSQVQREERAKKAGSSAEETKKEKGVLTGRITDETGAPVTDARIVLSEMRGRERVETKVDEDGYYSIKTVQQGGDFRLQIESQRWVGISYRDRQVLNLAPTSHRKHNLTLKRACRIRIRAVDERGVPIPNVRLMANSLTTESFIAPERIPTDKQGWATLGGLAPSADKYLIATMHKDYGFEKLVVTLNDPTQTPTHDLVLRKGRVVRGTAICSDGKPPVGWHILAMPSWWHFGVTPIGTTVAKDGSFAMPHIVPGKYDVTISVPRGERGASPKRVLSESNLWETEGLLKLKMDHPSPASMAYIVGRVKLVGNPRPGGFWVFADSTDGRFHSSTYLRNGRLEFRIGPVPKGTYNLKANLGGLKSDALRVSAPAEDVELIVSPITRPRVTGKVIADDTKELVTEFRVRVTKLRTLSGRNLVQDSQWREFNSAQGTSEIEFNGPGIYQFLVAADGFAWKRSEPVNTDENADELIHLSLTRGVTLNGTVVDEQGNPVDGATVLPLSKAAGTMPRALGRFPTEDGSYRLDNVPAGKYLVRDKDTRDAPALMEVALQRGQQRTLDLTLSNIEPANVRKGFLEARVWNAAALRSALGDAGRNRDAPQYAFWSDHIPACPGDLRFESEPSGLSDDPAIGDIETG